MTQLCFEWFLDDRVENVARTLQMYTHIPAYKDKADFALRSLPSMLQVTDGCIEQVCEVVDVHEGIVKYIEDKMLRYHGRFCPYSPPAQHLWNTDQYDTPTRP